METPIGMKAKIDFFLNEFCHLTKDIADLISSVISWSDEDKFAFCIAKRLFEENNEKLVNKKNKSDMCKENSTKELDMHSKKSMVKKPKHEKSHLKAIKEKHHHLTGEKMGHAHAEDTHHRYKESVKKSKRNMSRRGK